MYRRKTPSKKDLEHLIYRPFWTSARKTCFFNGKFFCRVVKPTFSCPEEHLQSNVSERKSWKHKDFWINFEVFGTMAEKFFQGCQNSNRCPGEELFEKRFQKRKNHFFFRFRAVFLIWVKKFAISAKPANYVSVENFWGKLFAKTYKIFHTSLVFEPEKPWSEFFFLCCHNCNPPVKRHFLIKSNFSKKSYVCSSVLEFEQFFLSFDKKVRVSKKQPTNTEKKWRKEFVEKSFFKSSPDSQHKSLNS